MGLLLGACDFRGDRRVILSGSRTEERLDVFVGHELVQKVEVVGASSADGDAHVAPRDG